MNSGNPQNADQSERAMNTPPSQDESHTMGAPAETEHALDNVSSSPVRQQEDEPQEEVMSAPSSQEVALKKQLEENPDEESEKRVLPFPVVGIGASAGGLKAFEQFIKALPQDSGMAFVLIQHLAPHHESELAELLQNHTSMAVNQIADSTSLEPNCIYVIPPGKSLTLRNGTLYLQEPEEARGHRAPIDLFFRSLAEDQGENAICIILSGTGSDGTLGLKAVKERAGITMAQLPEEADYDGMPTSAIRTNLVDLIGTAGELAKKLVAYRDSAAKIQLPSEEEALPEDSSEALSRIFAQLKARTGHDFTHYKRSTILRRIGRRLQVHGIASIQEYIGFLRINNDETQALFKDFLISVTNFFRDPDSFSYLEHNVLPELFNTKRPNDTLRIWVAGCATGEEAYSLAIVLADYAAQLDVPPDIQIFATDIDEQAITFAREGFYNEAIAADVAANRLHRYFNEERGGYRVKKEIREMVLFAVHNLINDPPFSRLDLISCRNLLIYLNRDVQKSVFELFHYALRPGGFLFLGSSESVEGTTAIFTTRDKKYRLYQRTNMLNSSIHALSFPLFKSTTDDQQSVTRRPLQQRSFAESYQEWRLRQYTPPAIIVNEQYDLVHVFGDAGRYLQVKEGPATHNIIDQISTALRLDLRTALYQAFQKEERTISRRLQVDGGKEPHVVRLHVGKVMLEGFPTDLVEIVFEEVEPRPELLETTAEAIASPSERQIVSQLEDELQRTRERLQTTVEEHETSNEELKASNEELQSMNEELQSATEELETGKEELQSMNEELVTVNQELKNKIEELSRANSDLLNLMTATDIGTIFLDRNLCIKRFTPRIQDLFNILSSDIGRPFLHVSHKINYDGLPEDTARALRDLVTIEKELESKDGGWFVVRIVPYRTLDNKIDGVVLTFFEITSLKHTQQILARREKQQAAVAALGQLALENVPLQELFNTATATLCTTLELPYCDLLEHDLQSNEMFMHAGVGWRDGIVGQLHFANEEKSRSRYIMDTTTSHHPEPLYMEDVANETRFQVTPYLLEHPIRSGIVVNVPGIEQTWGILGAYSSDPYTFSEDDAHFLQAVANLLAEAINRKRAEAQIRLSEERFRIALKEAPITVFNQDTDLRYTWVYNPVSTGPDLESIIGKRDDDLMERPDDAIQLTTLKRQVLESGKGLREEVAIVFGEEERFFDLTIEPLLNQTKEVIGITCATTDITEIKQTEHLLRTSEKRLQIAVSNTGLSISHVDKELRYTWILNPQHRFPLDEIIGKTDAELLGEERSAKLTAMKRQTLESGVGRHDEIAMQMPEGLRVWDVTMEPLFDLNDEVTGVTTASLEITHRKAVENALKQSEAQLHLAVEAGRMGIWQWNFSTDKAHWNELQFQLMGMAPDDALTPDRITQCVHPDERDGIVNFFSQLATQKSSRAEIPFEYEFCVVHANQETRWLATRGAIRIENTEPIEMLGITFDITTQKKQEQEIRNFNAELEQRVQQRTIELERSNTELDQFVYVASHDLRAPLRAIQQLSEWLVEDLGDQLPASVQKHIDRIANRVQRMERMLDDLLIYSRTYKHDAMAVEPVNLSALARKIFDMVAPLEGARLTVPDSLPTIQTVRTPLELVLRNLISNAIKHHHRTEIQIQVEAEVQGDMIEIRVSDDGPGIAPEYHERIFGLFQTLQPRDQVEGSGMGLAIIRKAVTEQGGSIRVQSAEGKGTTFIFTWPLL